MPSAQVAPEDVAAESSRGGSGGDTSTKDGYELRDAAEVETAAGSATASDARQRSPEEAPPLKAEDPVCTSTVEGLLQSPECENAASDAEHALVKRPSSRGALKSSVQLIEVIAERTIAAETIQRCERGRQARALVEELAAEERRIKRAAMRWKLKSVSQGVIAANNIAADAAETQKLGLGTQGRDDGTASVMASTRGGRARVVAKRHVKFEMMNMVHRDRDVGDDHRLDCVLNPSSRFMYIWGLLRLALWCFTVFFWPMRAAFEDRHSEANDLWHLGDAIPDLCEQSRPLSPTSLPPAPARARPLSRPRMLASVFSL